MKYTIKWESNGKKHPHYGKSKSTSFLGSPHMMGFASFSFTIGNWWGNPCISHLMKYPIGWESYGKKSHILWEKYEYQFCRFTPFDGFCCIFLDYEKLMGKPMHFPYNKVYHMVQIGWNKRIDTMGKVWISISDFPHTMGCIFPYCGNLWGNPYISHMMTLVNFSLWEDWYIVPNWL